MHLEWESINPMFDMSFIINCRKIWKAIIKKLEVQVEMDLPSECVVLYASQDVQTQRFLIDQAHRSVDRIPAGTRKAARNG